jgi:hypothetical protein
MEKGLCAWKYPSQANPMENTAAACLLFVYEWSVEIEGFECFVLENIKRTAISR